MSHSRPKLVSAFDPKRTLHQMRFALALLLTTWLPTSLAQKAVPVVDFAKIEIGRPYPIKALFEPKKDGSPLPFYSFTVPMPRGSAFNVFTQYDVDAMLDTRNVYSLRARRAFDSYEGCARALKTLIDPLLQAFKVKPTKSEMSLFEASAGDIEIQASCSFSAGSPYPTLALFVSSKAEKERVSEHLKKKARR